MSQRMVSNLAHAVLIACSLSTLACGRFFLSEQVSRSPAVATSNDGFSGGFAPPPSTAAVWAEQISADAVAVVGKAFDGFGSNLAGAAPLQRLSDPIPLASGSGVTDPTSAIAGAAVVRLDDGFFVVWMQRLGPMKGRFTDLALVPSGSAFQIHPDSGDPLHRFKLWAFYIRSRDRVVVFWENESTQITYAMIDTASQSLLGGVEVLPDPAPFADVSYAAGPQRGSPFMMTYLLPAGDLRDPFTVYAAFLSFDSEARTLLVDCRANVSQRSTPAFNNVAGAAHPAGNRFVVYDERNGDLFGRFVSENCSVGPEIALGTRLVESSSGQVPPRALLPLDLEFESSGAGLVALRQGVTTNLVEGGRTFVLAVLPLIFDASTVSAGALKRVGVASRDGLPYSNRSFQLAWDFDDVFKLVFDEVEIGSNFLANPSTWRVLFNALDASGSTVDP